MSKKRKKQKQKNNKVDIIDLTVKSSNDGAVDSAVDGKETEEKVSLQEASNNSEVIIANFEQVDEDIETGETIPMSDVIKAVNETLGQEQGTVTEKAEEPKAKKKLVTKIAIGILIALLAIIGLGYGFYHYEFTRLQKVDKEAYNDENVIAMVEADAEDSETKAAAKAMEEQTADLDEAEVTAAEGEVFKDSSVFNILLIGTDDRTDDFSEDARGDTSILLSLNKNSGKVHLISFERGIGVPILDGYYAGQWDWLTHTFRYGGAELMTAEVRENFKVDVDHYVRVNIRTLIELIDAIGGVDVAVNAAEAEHINHPEGTYTKGYITGMHVENEMQELHPGINHLNGATAMVYARTRALDDDWHRVRRQRRIIMAAASRLSKLSAPDLIVALNDLVPFVQTNLSELDVASLLTVAPQFMGAKVDQMTIPKKGTYGVMRGMDGRDMFALDFDYNAKLLRSVLYDMSLEELGIDEMTNDVSSTKQRAGGTTRTQKTATPVQNVPEENTVSEEMTDQDTNMDGIMPEGVVTQETSPAMDVSEAGGVAEQTIQSSSIAEPAAAGLEQMAVPQQAVDPATELPQATPANTVDDAGTGMGY